MEKIGYRTLKGLCSSDKQEMNDSFNVIFNKYRYLVYYVSYDILKNEEESKDIVNDTFMKMYEKRHDFNSETKLKYFLMVTAKNLSINRYNQLKDHLTYSDDIGEATDNEGVNIYLEKFKEVLDEEEYRYLVLHLIYGFKFKEIAVSNNLTTWQVSSKYERGINKLRKIYGGKY